MPVLFFCLEDRPTPALRGSWSASLLPPLLGSIGLARFLHWAPSLFGAGRSAPALFSRNGYPHTSGSIGLITLLSTNQGFCVGSLPLNFGGVPCNLAPIIYYGYLTCTSTRRFWSGFAVTVSLLARSPNGFRLVCVGYCRHHSYPLPPPTDPLLGPGEITRRF